MISKPLWRLVLLFGLVLILDQITKMIALATLPPGIPVPVLGNTLRWTLVYNPSGAFSLRLGSPQYYLISSVIIFCFLIYYIIRNRHINHIAIPLSIVAGGAAGNIIDRFRFGQVIDFIDCDIPDIVIGSYHLERWPIFNIADSALSCGIIITLLLIYFHKDKKGDLPDSDRVSS